MASRDLFLLRRNDTDTGPIADQVMAGVNVFTGQQKNVTTQFDAVTGTTGATLTNLVGLTGFDLAAGATYAFEIWLSGVSTANSGIKVGFKYTTATLTSLLSLATAHAAASTATAQTTTATDQATLFGSNAAAWLGVRLTGQIVVNAAGTLALQAAQNAAHADTTSIYAGSFMRLSRIG